MADAAMLFERHHLALYRYLRRQSGSADLAEELTQEVFVRVVRSTTEPEPGLGERAWLFRIARNLELNRRRDKARQPLVESEEKLPPSRPQPALALDLDRALERLGETDREAFLMRELGGLGYDEIGALCDLTPNAVRSRIHRARTSLRTLIGERAPSARGGSSQEATP